MKALVKKTMGLVLVTLVAFGVTAGTMQAFADGSRESQSSDKYTEVDLQEPYMKDAELHVYSVKDDKSSPAADITINHKNLGGFCPQLLGFREYAATAKEGWVFKNWTYEQLFNGKDYENYKVSSYSFSQDHDHKTTPYKSGNVISVNRTGTIGESAIIKRIYKVYANLNPTITATAGEVGSITPPGMTEVQYGENQTYNFTAKEGYVIDSLKIDGKEQTVEHTASGSYEFKAVKSPHTIAVSFAKVYTITYTDGVNGEEIFADQVHRNALVNKPTPAFEGADPKRKDYVFAGWNPPVATNVTADATYVAQWKADKNHNQKPDDQEQHFTVKYTDGVDGEEIFKDQVHENILVGMPTPAFKGETPHRKDYVFAGWNPPVATNVTADATYEATWKKDHFTVTFKDGDKTQTVKVKNGKAIDTDALTDQSMPKDPTKAGYTFKEWNTREDGKGEKFTGTSVVNGDMTVYAIYTQDSVPTPKPTPTPELKPQSETPAPKPELKPQPTKHIGMIPKTGESASYAGLLAALGFSIVGLEILRKKKMMEENNK